MPEAYCTLWEKWRSELPLLERMAVPRCVRPTDFGKIKSTEIYIFSDAKPIKLNENRTQLIVQELEDEELAIIHYTQWHSFDQELKSLGQVHGEKKEHSHTCQQKSTNETGKKSSLYHLDPLLDNGLLRVGDRLSNTDIPDESKHQLVLPRKGHVTSLVIRHTNEQLGYAGRGHVLAKLRDKYWIVGANSAVRQMIPSCVRCERHRATPKEQKWLICHRIEGHRQRPLPMLVWIILARFSRKKVERNINDMEHSSRAL